MIERSDVPPCDYDRAPEHERMIEARDVVVPMRDGVNLSIDVYRPDAPARFPALLAFSIYNKDLQGPDVAASLPAQPAWAPLWKLPDTSTFGSDDIAISRFIDNGALPKFTPNRLHHTVTVLYLSRSTSVGTS